MLQEIDDALIRLLLGELEREGIREKVQVLAGAPPKDAGEGPLFNFFLYDVVENAVLRDQSFEVRPTAELWTVGKSRRATRVDASYLLTAHADDTRAEHRMLGAAMRILLRHGYVLPQMLGESLAPFGDDGLRLMVAQRERDPATVWQASGHPLRPSIGIVATAMVDPFETRTVRLVREAVLGLAQGAPNADAGRQVDLRSLRVSAAGRVVDDATETPIREAVFFVDEAVSGEIDVNGVFLARDLTPGRRKVRVEAPGYEAWEGEVDAAPPMRGGVLEPLDIRLKAKKPVSKKGDPTIEGILRFSDGRPAAFIPLSLMGRTTVTDDQGRYVFELESSGLPEILAPKEAQLSK